MMWLKRAISICVYTFGVTSYQSHHCYDNYNSVKSVNTLVLLKTNTHTQTVNDMC